MKKVNYLLALVALVAVFTTCEKNENSVVLGDKENPMPIFYSELVNDFKYIYTSSIKDIYNKAYDGENIDEKKLFQYLVPIQRIEPMLIYLITTSH